jgi:hypothetical protein
VAGGAGCEKLGAVLRVGGIGGRGQDCRQEKAEKSQPHEHPAARR